MTKLSFLVVAVLVGCQPGDGASPPKQLAQNPITTMRGTTPDPNLQTDVAAPFTLTASDGSGLELTRIDAKAVVEGPLAFTELHLYFKNSESRIREGTFAITLPSGAAVSRFAMQLDGRWQEAEVVEKTMARRVYDDFLHRRQDPALLEKGAGNEFTARVFPIPANAEKHLILSFSQELAGRGYTLPLRGLPKTSRVDVALTVTSLDGKVRRQTLSQKHWQPDRDFVAQVSDVAAAVTSGDVVVGALAIADDASTSDPPQGVTLLVDTSASRGLGFAAYIKRVHSLIDALRARYGDELPLQVYAFDQFLELQHVGTANSYSDAIDQQIVARGAAGASNLDAALRDLPSSDHMKRLVIVTDGVMTAGRDTPALVEGATHSGFERIDVVLSGGIRDERLAAALARALPHAGDVFDLDRGTDAIAEGLGQTVNVDVPIDIPGALWVYPRTLPAARPGSTQMIFAKMKAPTRAIDIIIGGAHRVVHLGTAEPALVERAVAGAEIEEMENTLGSLQGDDARKRRLEIAKKSIQSRVVSSQTSMLVLETDDDYERYGIPRTALADILTVGPGGHLEQQHRTMLATASDPEVDMKSTSVDLATTEEVAESHDTAPHQDGHLRIMNNTSSRQNAIELARNAGVLGARPLDEGSFASLTGNTDFSSGFDSTADISNGFDSADVYGTGWGTIGSGSGYGIGGGRGGMRGRTSAVPTATLSTPTVQNNALDRAIVRRYLKRNIAKLQYCYELQLLAKPALRGTVAVTFALSPNGLVASAAASGVDTEVASCVADVVKMLEFPRPPQSSTTSRVDFSITYRPADVTTTYDSYDDGRDDQEERGGPALTGKLADVEKALKAKATAKALAIAKPWHDEAPGDVLALVAYAEAVQESDPVLASRLYGSIIDLFPSRADMRRFAGERLEAASDDEAVRELVIDTYRRAVADRPDHASGHRLLAYALLRAKDYRGAFEAILAGVDQDYPDGRYLGADRVMSEDAGIIAAAYLAAQPDDEDVVLAELDKREIVKATTPSTRFVMYWETDANDVDFHIRDARGGHAWYSHKRLRSGGELYADITTGYGPECFTVKGTPTAGPYKLSINYFSQGPMGYGMGLLQIMKFDGSAVTFEDRPYVIMTDHAFVDLGSY